MVPPCSNRISRVPPYSRTCRSSTRTGLSPSMGDLSRSFRLLTASHWPGPRSLVTTNGVSVDVLSSGYLDISVHRVRLATLWIHVTIPLRVGFPIRKFWDQRVLAPPPDFSQRATSFIASQRQGIHQMPLVHCHHPTHPKTVFCLLDRACHKPIPGQPPTPKHWDNTGIHDEQSAKDWPPARRQQSTTNTVKDDWSIKHTQS